MRWRAIAVTIVVIVACLIALSLASDVLVDWLWFSAVGYLDVFWTIFGAKAVLFIRRLPGLDRLPLGERNAGVPVRSAPRALASRILRPGIRDRPDLARDVARAVRGRIPSAVVAVAHRGRSPSSFGILIAAGETGNWDPVLRFIHQAPYGQRDPLYGKDIGFYLFSLPAYVALKNWMLVTLVLSAFAAGAVYWAHGDIVLDGGQRLWMSSAAAAHGSVLLGLFFAVKAWSYGLDRFLLLYGDNGVVVGAGYTDIHVELPVLWVLVGLASAAALASWANVRVRTYKLPLAAAVLVFGSSFVLALVFPALFQRCLREAERVAVGGALPPAEHRPHPGGL